jgi:hypothetical protein
MKRGTIKPKAASVPGILRTANIKPGRPRLRASRKAVPAVELTHFKRVAALPCACCGIDGYSQAAHSNRHQDGKGLGLKADYRATFPLCCTRPGVVGCHVEHDQLIGMTRAEADGRTAGYIADTKKKLGLIGPHKTGEEYASN